MIPQLRAVPSVQDACFSGQTVLIRVDFNSPLEPGTHRILDDSRISSSVPTISKLVNDGAKLIVLSHQGQPGSDDFVSLRTHSEVLSQKLGTNVKFVPKLVGDEVKEEVARAKAGEVVVLENVRFNSEETLNLAPPQHANSEMVRFLSSISDVYVNEAFSACHRNHASLVGFPYRLPSFMGLQLRTELEAVSKLLGDEARPSAFLLGGGKVADAVDLVRMVASRSKVDKLILFGLVGLVFLVAQKPERRNRISLENVPRELVGQAAKILSDYGEKIVLPKDCAFMVDLRREEAKVDDLPPGTRVLDIGEETVNQIRLELNGFKTAFMRGPPGVIEKAGFEKGTAEVLRMLSELHIYTVIGGGHTRVLAEKMRLVGELGYVSTGGGALLSLVAGKDMPALQALADAQGRTEVYLEEHRAQAAGYGLTAEHGRGK
ncbi:MAG: phosphoglycerate kinase [Thermoprotei archaeon]